ncbi:MAG: hypothetical protein LBF27_30845 [Sphingobacterium sp.]|nr:hypothetical protein [Sphingobacterium sp.]
MNTHTLFDKRQKKPIVYRVAEYNEDYTVQQIDTFKFGKSSLRFITPNFISLNMNSHERALKNAKEIYQQLVKPKQKENQLFEFSEQETVLLYDYFEYIQTAIISITTAIEALTNALIPEDYILKEKDKGEDKELNKGEIERTKGTIVKLKKIIPDALSISSPTKLKSWTKFTQLIDLRNDLIHLKSFTLSPSAGDRHIVTALLDEKVFNKINAGSLFIGELARLVPFHNEYPILHNTEKLIPIKIEKWYGTFKKVEE